MSFSVRILPTSPKGNMIQWERESSRIRRIETILMLAGQVEYEHGTMKIVCHSIRLCKNQMAQHLSIWIEQKKFWIAKTELETGTTRRTEYLVIIANLHWFRASLYLVATIDRRNIYIHFESGLNIAANELVSFRNFFLYYLWMGGIWTWSSNRNCLWWNSNWFFGRKMALVELILMRILF